MRDASGESGGGRSGGVDALAALVRALLEGAGKPEVPAVAAEQLPKFGSVEQMAKLTGVCKDTVYRMIRDGEFPAIKMRGRYVVPWRAMQQLEADALSAGQAIDLAEWTQRWLEEQRQGSAA